MEIFAVISQTPNGVERIEHLATKLEVAVRRAEILVESLRDTGESDTKVFMARRKVEGLKVPPKSRTVEYKKGIYVGDLFLDGALKAKLEKTKAK